MNPKISAIMPTRGRPALAQKAIQYFAAQTYENKELIVVDDIEDRSFPDGIRWDGFQQIQIPRALYFLHSSRKIGLKRNQCCRLAVGDVIAHWDSDDYSSPDRLESQMKILLESKLAVTGFNSMLFWDDDSSAAWKYEGSSGYAIGSSLMYQRSWWARNPFSETREIGEDNEFVSGARASKEMIAVDGGQTMVARIHSGNTSRKYPQGIQYRKLNREDIPTGFFA